MPPTRALAVFLLALAGPALAQGGPPPAPPVTVAKPVVKDIVEWDDFIGRLDSVDQVDIRARVSGYLDKVHFVDGSLVKAGDLLFTIDPRPYQNSLQEAVAAVSSAQAGIDFSQSDLDRAEQLRRTGNITDQLLSQRRQSYLTTKAELDRSQASQRQAQLNLDFTEIRAPIAGRISRRLVSQGNLVSANDTLLTNIVAMDPVYFYFDVDERSYLAYLRQSEGGTQPSRTNLVQLTLTNERDPSRSGHLDFIDNRLDNASGTIRARAVFENKDLALTPGLFGRISIRGSESYKGILIPDEAVGADQDRRIVYVVDANNIVSAKPVRPGPRIDGYRVIRTGLDGSESVVVNGIMRVRPGAKVTPQIKTLPPVREKDGT